MDKTNDGKKGGWLVGKRHYDKSGKPIGGIPAVVGDSKRPVELEGGEVIINREASKKYWRELSKINQSAGNGVPIKPQDVGADEDPEEYKEGGKVIEFNPNRLPNKRIYNYAKSIKEDYPKVWSLGGNIFGNEAFKNLERVIKRGYWTDNEEWMYIKWRSFVARHKGDFRIAGVIAMLKWVDKVDKGWEYMKNLIEEEIEKKYPKKKKGGVVTYKQKYNKKYGYKENESHDLAEISKDTGVSGKGLRQIYNKGVGAYKTNPESVRPNVRSKEQWAMGRVYSAVMGGKAAKIDANELKMETGGKVVLNNITQYLDNDKKCYTKTYSYHNSNVIIDYCEGEFFKINTISTKESDRRKGYATKLVDYVKNFAKQLGFSKIQLYLPIDKRNTRPEYLSFYKKNGFEFYPNSSIKMFFDLNKMAKGGNLYHLGGDMSKHLAPNGKPSNLTHEQWHLVRTPEFKAWFGDWENDPKNASKVVDENGEPLVVYNRSKISFNVFDISKQLNGWLGKGFYFSNGKKEFKEYGNKIIISFLNVKNPFIVKGDSPSDFLYEIKKELGIDESNTTPLLKDNNFDGVIYKHWDYESTMFTCFEPEQIKLADGTNTTFDGNNPDIRYEDGGSVEHLISEGIVDLKMYDTTPEHAKEYGFDVKNPLYVQSLCISESERLKGMGKKVLDYIDEYAVKNGHDLIFGHITQKANFTKDSRHTDLCDIDLIKEFLRKDEYNTIEGNNDFYKFVKTNPDIRYEGGGQFEQGGELAKGIKTEQEHKDTLEKIASGEITVNQAIKMTAKDHLKENPKYYTELSKIEKHEDGGALSNYSLKTPNGEKSRLTYLQQILVRTEKFKEFFGDWETAAKSYLLDNKKDFKVHFKNVSKVMDMSTLEPRVVYHGTRSDAEFFTFDVSMEKGQGRPYAYFAHNREYSQNFTEFSQRGHSNSSGYLYECFLNVRNPFMAMGDKYEFKKKDYESWIKTITETIALEKYQTIELNKTTEKLEKAIRSQIEDYMSKLTDKVQFWKYMAADTNSIFKYFLISYGYDGVFYGEELANNYNAENPKEYTNAVTIFSAKDIKLADGRNLNFNPMETDIRYKDGGSVGEPQKTMSKKDRLGSLLFGEKYETGGFIEDSIGHKSIEKPINDARTFVEQLNQKMKE